MESFEEMFEGSLKTLKANTVVEGEILAISNGEIFVNLGYKADGIVDRNEFSYDDTRKVEDIYKVGDKIQVYVVNLNDGRGNVELSLKKLESEKNKINFDNAAKNNEIVEGKVVKVLEKGIKVDAMGISVFIPGSQLSNKNMKEYNGKTISFKILTNERNRIIGSEKIVVKENRSKKIEEVFENIHVGDTVKGIVKKINEYGAFVDIGGAEGLLHVSQMSWKRNVNANDFVKEGQEMEVTVIEMDKESGRIALKSKKEEENPWLKIGTEINQGDVVTVTVQKILAFGVFVEIIDGIDGFIHIAQISHERIAKPNDVLEVGQQVQAKIIKIDIENKKIELTIKGLEDSKLNEDVLETKEVATDEAVAE